MRTDLLIAIKELVLNGECCKAVINIMLNIIGMETHNGGYS